MKQLPLISILCLTAGFLLSCKSDGHYAYAIRDFRKPVRPYLIETVSKGIVGYSDAEHWLQKHLTDKELTNLSHSEHPVLRTFALREMLQRNSIDHFKLIMSHLDDTATVPTFAGEWGIWFRTVSEDMIENGKWKTIEDKNKTIHKLITQHNYLKPAYEALTKIPVNDQYYPYIKEMVTRDKPFEEIEYALYALARYKKKENIQQIKSILLHSYYRMGSLSFNLMEEFPDEVYMEVLKDYYRRIFYRKICRDQITYDATPFLNALASYKTDSSAKILSDILNRKPFLPCTYDAKGLLKALMYAIRDNDCPAYRTMKKRADEFLQAYEEELIPFGLSVDSVIMKEEPTTEPVEWNR